MIKINQNGRSCKKEKINVFIAEDHPVVRAGIRNELNKQEDIEVVGEAASGQETLDQVFKLQPAVLTLDLNLPDMNGLQVMSSLLDKTGANSEQNFSLPDVLVLSAHCSREYVSALFAHGIKGYLLKDEELEKVVEAIYNIVQGKPALSDAVVQMLMMGDLSQQVRLTKRELEILQLVAYGYSNKQISKELGIAVGTVKNHVTNIYEKLPDVHTRAEAVAWAWQNEIVTR